MSMPPSFEVSDILDALKDGAGARAYRLVGGVGAWFARQFNDQSADEKLETMNAVRPILRRAGFDIRDSDTGEQVGCDFCEEPRETERYDRVEVYMRPPSYGFDAEMSFRVEFNDDYAYGFNVPVKYCPMCGRRLD